MFRTAFTDARCRNPGTGRDAPAANWQCLYPRSDAAGNDRSQRRHRERARSQGTKTGVARAARCGRRGVGAATSAAARGRSSARWSVRSSALLPDRRSIEGQPEDRAWKSPSGSTMHNSTAIVQEGDEAFHPGEKVRVTAARA